MNSYRFDVISLDNVQILREIVCAMSASGTTFSVIPMSITVRGIGGAEVVKASNGFCFISIAMSRSKTSVVAPCSDTLRPLYSASGVTLSGRN